MKLYLMRHGPAEEHAESGIDSDRALTAAGRARVRGVAKLLLDATEAPVHIVTSPLVRAVQTAEIVAIGAQAGGGSATVEARRDLEPGSDMALLAKRLGAEGGKRLMLVGHEPDLSTLGATLVSTFASVVRSFDKAMVVGFHLPLDGGPAHIRFVVDPKALRLELVGDRRGP